MTADTVGGVWTYALELAAALQRHGIDVYLASMGGRAPKCTLPANVELYESDFRLEWMEDPWDDVRRAGDWLLELEQRLKPDLIHLNNYAHGALGWHAPVVMVGHSCVLSWWKAVHGKEAPAQWDRYREEVRRGLQSADVVIAPSSAMLQELERYYGPFRTGRVVANGVQAGMPAPREKQRGILTAGRLWDQAKNVQALASIVHLVKWPIHVAGSRHHPGGSVCEPAGLKLLGHLTADDLAGWYSRASIYALPARYEPFGLSVLEAALWRCALVLGDIASLRENWDSAAIFVDPDDAQALSAALESLIEDETLRYSLAEKAHARALQFSPPRMATGYLAAYQAATEMLACA